MPLSIDTLKIEDKNLTGLNVGYDKEIYLAEELWTIEERKSVISYLDLRLEAP